MQYLPFDHPPGTLFSTPQASQYLMSHGQDGLYPLEPFDASTYKKNRQIKFFASTYVRQRSVVNTRTSPVGVFWSTTGRLTLMSRLSCA